jgi:pyruvate-formate lyase-activating enzyme
LILTPSPQSIRLAATNVANDIMEIDSASMKENQELMEKVVDHKISLEDTFKKLCDMQAEQHYAGISCLSKHCEKVGVKSPVIPEYMAMLEELRPGAQNHS